MAGVRLPWASRSAKRYRVRVSTAYRPASETPTAWQGPRQCDNLRNAGFLEPAMTRWVYSFVEGKADGKAEMRNLLGGKGANLAEMSNLGLPVPPGFTITSEVCTYYYRNNGTYPAGLKAEVETALAKVGEQMGAKFGDSARVVLVSVRSGARVSMPGMMDTVLNLGLNPETTE